MNTLAKALVTAAVVASAQPAGAAAAPDVATDCTTHAAAGKSLESKVGKASRSSEDSSIDAYKRDVACRIHARNGSLLFDGAPPPMLKSVTVLQLTIDATGKVRSITVRRSHGYRDLDRVALTSVRNALPLPPPPVALLRRGNAEFFETWLFRDDGRFQLRSLAPEQAYGSDSAPAR